MMNTIVIFATLLGISAAVDIAPNSYEDSVLRPQGEPQLIHASLPNLAQNKLPQVQYISAPENKVEYISAPAENIGGYAYSYIQNPRYNYNYQYVRNIPAYQRQYQYQYQLRPATSTLLLPANRYQYQYQYQIPYVNLLPSLGGASYIIPFKK